jgi:hypothetical protein
VLAPPLSRARARPGRLPREFLGRARRRLWPTGRARELLGLGLVGLALLGLFGRAVVPGVLGHQRDTGAFYYPLTAWFAQELQAGRFPLWCPLIFGGYPLLADGEIGMLYPPNVLALLALPSGAAFVLVRTAHYFVAGLGTYALARALGVGRPAAAYAGLAFALGAFMVGHLDHGNILRSAAWLPPLLACAELALRAGGRRALGWAALAAACLALAGLGLHPQILLIDLVALWSYLPMRAMALATGPGTPDGPGRAVAAALTRCLLVLAGVTLLGLGAAAAQLAPTYELGMLSSRGDGVPYSLATGGALSPFDLVTLLLPYLFRADPRNVWSLFPYWETTLYVGLVGIVLAMVGLLLGRRRAVLPLAGLALVGLALAMADYFPVDLYSWLWTLPGFSSMRMPGRHTVVVELALAVLAAIGLDRLLAEAGSRRARRIVSLVGGFALVVVVALVGVRLWVEADEGGSLAAIQAGYLSLSRQGVPLSAEQVRRGLLSTLSPANHWTAFAVATLLSTTALLWSWQRQPGLGRRWQGLVILVAVGELLAVAHAFHPTTPVGSLAEASGPMRFLSQREGLWRAFIVGRSDSSITSRPALFGVAQPYGYSSLPTVRMERYWGRVNEVDDELLDLWNSRYVVVSKHAPGRIWAQDVLFDPARPLLDGPAANPLGHEAFRLTPTRTDAIRLLSGLNGAAGLPDGTAVAELVVSGGDTPPETLTVRLGIHTTEAAYDDPLEPTSVHSRAPVGYRWEARDGSSRIYPRNLYVADLALAGPRIVERVEVRAVAPVGQFRLSGAALLDRSATWSGSLLTTHREKYTVAYEDEWTTILENHAVQPRAFIAREAVVAPPDEWALVRLLESGFDPRRQVLLERPSHAGLDGAGAAAPGSTGAAAAGTVPEAVAVERYETERVVVRATSAQGGHLVLTDTFYPGWRAWLDGGEVPIERANYLFRAVRLPPGEHVVEFRFQPTTLYVSGAASLLVWLGLAALVFVGWGGHRLSWRRRGARPRPAPVPAGAVPRPAPVPAGWQPAPRAPALGERTLAIGQEPAVTFSLTSDT